MGNNLIHSYSQYAQDQEAAKVCNKRDGFFLDIGSGPPTNINNTCALERELGWRGILIDIDDREIQEARRQRASENQYIQSNLEIENISDILDRCGCPAHIDYISFDVDDANLNVIKNFNFNKYSFTFATFEHDFYRIGDVIKVPSMEIFIKNGYKLYRENVECVGIGGAFEDWWIKE
jgi:hypothetical protein